MSEGFQFGDVIFLALVAGFILLRLRNTLGKTIDDDSKKPPRRTDFTEDNERIIQLPERVVREPAHGDDKKEDTLELSSISNPEVTKGLLAIRGVDADFSPTGFLDGAKMAFDMVFDAFAKGNKDQLRMLLNDAPLKNFLDVIDAQESADVRTETTLVSIDNAEIVEASLNNHIAQVTVKFTTQQITLTRNAAREVIAGDPSVSHQSEDIWTFERDVRSRNPNWKISDT